MELLGGVEDTWRVDEKDEGGGVDEEEVEVERGVEGTNVVREAKESDEEEKVLGSKVDVGVGVVDVKVNVERSWVVVGVLVSVLENIMIVTVSNGFRTPVHARRIKTESRARE